MIIKPLNPPTEREREALTILQEEASEVIKEVSKILRFGWDSHHPNFPDNTNRKCLEEEIGQLEHMIFFLKHTTQSLNPENIADARLHKVHKLERYSSLYEPEHHDISIAFTEEIPPARS
jgi:predicted metallo-beta-lactamase superfamily hydrolase